MSSGNFQFYEELAIQKSFTFIPGTGFFGPEFHAFCQGTTPDSVKAVMAVADTQGEPYTNFSGALMYHVADVAQAFKDRVKAKKRRSRSQE